MNTSKIGTLLVLVILIIAVGVAIDMRQSSKLRGPEVCNALGGIIQNDKCVLSRESDVAQSTVDIGCPEDEYLAGITTDQKPVCRAFSVSRNSSSAENSKNVSLEDNSQKFIGGWKMNGICHLDSAGKFLEPCNSPDYEKIGKCAADLKPTYLAMNDVRATIPVPCLEKAARCFVDDIGSGKIQKTVRSFLLCDEYKINYFKIPARQ